MDLKLAFILIVSLNPEESEYLGIAFVLVIATSFSNSSTSTSFLKVDLTSNLLCFHSQRRPSIVELAIPTFHNLLGVVHTTVSSVITSEISLHSRSDGNKYLLALSVAAIHFFLR